MRKRRNIEIFSLYFLDGMSCAFGAVIMLLLITKAAEPLIIEQAKTDRQGLIASLQQELFDIRGETEVLNRNMVSAEQRAADARELLALLQGELSKIRGQFAASKEEGMDAEDQGQLLSARQKLTEEMRQLLANYKPPEKEAVVGGIPVDSQYIILVIDNSGSMQEYWRFVVRKVLETLQVYPRVKGIQVMNNNGRYLFSSYAGKWIPDSPTVRQRMIDALATWNAFSDSNPTEGVIDAVNTFYEPGKSISIYYFGDDFPSGQVEAVARAVEKVNKSDEMGNRLVRIHAVGFPTHLASGEVVNALRFANLMRALCERNGGAFVALATLN